LSELSAPFLQTNQMPFSNYIRSNAFKFKTKYALPIIASLLTYVVIGQIYSNSLTESDLTSSNGQVSIIKQEILLHNKSGDTTKKVSIKLSNGTENFFLFDNTGDAYELLKQNVNIGDTISILHKTKFQSIIGVGGEYQVLKLAKDNDVLYSFDKAKQTFGEISIWGIIVVIGLWTLYFYFRHILKLQEQQPT
jgi:hypothetical protein